MAKAKQPVQARPVQQQARTPHMKRMQQARTTLLLDQPFFGTLALNLGLIEDPTCDTAWTDGRSLGYSPAFIDTLDNDTLVGLIAHEVMHCAAGHPWRRENRHPFKWNVAADYAINDILKEAKFKLPDGALLDAQYHGKWSEWIYDRLPDMPQQQPKQGKSGQNGKGTGSGFGEVRDAPSDNQTDPNDPTGQNKIPAPSESDWKQAVKQAVKASQGKLPASIKRQFEDMLKPVVDWRGLLRRYIQEAAKTDYTWRRPNSRYMASGLYLPSVRSEAMGKITIAVDTSGSIDNVLLSQFAAEMRSIAEDLQPSSVEVVYCDAAVNRVDTFERGEHLTVEACGGGGTSFVPVFEHVDNSPELPAVVVYLTDMYGSFPDTIPDYPVIWASYSQVDSAPFGDVIPCV